jgi:DNA-binding transcriptional LysR family regulator
MHAVQLQAIDLNLLVALEAMLSERSVTRAGARLGLSPSAMSHALARLRTTFGDDLLVRTRGGMVATARGEQLLGPLRRALEELAVLVAGPGGFDPGSSQREFTLATTDYVEAVLLPPLLSRISAAAPGVQLRVRPLEISDVVEPLERGSYDAAIGVAFDVSPGLQQQALFSEEMVLVCRKGHPLVKRSVDLATYLELRHVMVSVRGGSQGGGGRAAGALGAAAADRAAGAAFFGGAIDRGEHGPGDDGAGAGGVAAGGGAGVAGVDAAAGGAGLHGEAGVARAAAGRPGAPVVAAAGVRGGGGAAGVITAGGGPIRRG